MEEEWFIYLNRCIENLNDFPADAPVRDWYCSTDLTEKVNWKKKNEKPYRLKKSCRCFAEYEKGGGIEVFTANIKASGGYVNYINKKKYHCVLRLDNDAGLFNVLKKYFEKKGMLVDIVKK